MFEALSERDQALAGVITGSNETFEALASEDEALAESFQILPTFERESRLTFDRLDEFQADTRPLIQQLIPIANDLSPTLASVRRLSPNLKSLFEDLDVLITVEQDRACRRCERTLNGLAPVLDALDPFLANLNPVIRYLEFQKTTVTDFLAGPGVALANSVDPIDANQAAPRHYLRQLGYLGAETLGVHESRLPTNRSNGYLAPGALTRSDRPRRGCSPASTAATSTTPVRPPTRPPARRTRRTRRSTPRRTRSVAPSRPSPRLSRRASSRSRSRAGSAPAASPRSSRIPRPLGH